MSSSSLVRSASSASPDSSRRNGASTALEEEVTPGTWKAVMESHAVERKPLSWLDPRVLWQSRNEFVTKIHDRVPQLRQRWMADFAESGPPPVDLGYKDFVFCLMGDTGEGDSSQWALLPTLNRVGEDAKFIFICSDIIYSAGHMHEYREKFYWPYSHLPKPIYAIPGNHDWYDSLDGFMEHLCDRRPRPAWIREETTGNAFRRLSTGFRRQIATVLWRKSTTPDVGWITLMKQFRADWPQARRPTCASGSRITSPAWAARARSSARAPIGRRPACSSSVTRSTRSTGSGCRSGRRTTCWRTTATAP